MEILFKNVDYIYQPNSPFQFKALTDVNLKIESGSFTAIIGKTGSGKSTLIRHLNGLLKPSSGEVKIGNLTITSSIKESQLSDLRRKVGMLFQFPEQQLFADTVEHDIEFGPINFGTTKEKAKKIARESLKKVGLNDEFLNRSPLELSGGQMRRVALAGVLAVKPDILVLDEPTAGLDFIGKKEIMKLIKKLQLEEHTTIILVSNSMEDVADYAEEVILLSKGKVIKRASPNKIFSNKEITSALGIETPQTTVLAEFLLERGVDFKGSLPINEKSFNNFLKKIFEEKKKTRIL
ncbi:energy-coupling factor transporter ATPase [Oenococcus oeni]|uniref:energy-coupling factor transporter ATPase n=1 Tax=Oenococcus oeni TaxID=1247 RepID=UPI0008F905AC|nr:energy-coupling factor transporter ATPase [Oenococcus oeni]OIL77998.1 energy-coupling factor transporter ATPase [Oenococcus oeni]